MSPRLISVVLLAATAASPALAASDLLYHHRPSSELPVLRSYHQQPYWRALAECAGIHGVLVNRYEAAGRSEPAQTAKARGVGFFRAATEQLKRDRGLPEAEARAVASQAVDAGRGSGAAVLGARTASLSAYTHEQMIDAMCTQVSERHQEAVRRSSR